MKNAKGFTTMDTVVAVLTIIIFSTLILTLIYNNTMSNIKIKKQALAMIYITEIFENVGLNNNYDNLNNETVLELLPDENYNFETEIEVTELDGDKEDIIKKITANVKYKIGKKMYALSMSRMKAKE